jgi:hypothetical protein
MQQNQVNLIATQGMANELNEVLEKRNLIYSIRTGNYDAAAFANNRISSTNPGAEDQSIELLL